MEDRTIQPQLAGDSSPTYVQRSPVPTTEHPAQLADRNSRKTKSQTWDNGTWEAQILPTITLELERLAIPGNDGDNSNVSSPANSAASSLAKTPNDLASPSSLEYFPISGSSSDPVDNPSSNGHPGHSRHVSMSELVNSLDEVNIDDNIRPGRNGKGLGRTKSLFAGAPPGFESLGLDPIVESSDTNQISPNGLIRQTGFEGMENANVDAKRSGNRPPLKRCVTFAGNLPQDLLAGDSSREGPDHRLLRREAGVDELPPDHLRIAENENNDSNRNANFANLRVGTGITENNELSAVPIASQLRSHPHHNRVMSDVGGMQRGDSFDIMRQAFPKTLFDTVDHGKLGNGISPGSTDSNRSPTGFIGSPASSNTTSSAGSKVHRRSQTMSAIGVGDFSFSDSNDVRTDDFSNNSWHRPSSSVNNASNSWFKSMRSTSQTQDSSYDMTSSANVPLNQNTPAYEFKNSSMPQQQVNGYNNSNPYPPQRNNNQQQSMYPNEVYQQKPGMPNPGMMSPQSGMMMPPQHQGDANHQQMQALQQMQAAQQQWMYHWMQMQQSFVNQDGTPQQHHQQQFAQMNAMMQHMNPQQQKGYGYNGSNVMMNPENIMQNNNFQPQQQQQQEQQPQQHKKQHNHHGAPHHRDNNRHQGSYYDDHQHNSKGQHGNGSNHHNSGKNRGNARAEHGTVITAGMSPLLAEHKSTGRRPEFHELAGNVVEFSRDSHGSRFIQYKMEMANPEEKMMLVNEILGDAVSLMQDLFGNYVMQNFLEHGTPMQRSAIASTIKGSMLTLSTQPHGCRVVQRALDLLSIAERNGLLAELLLPSGNIVRCSRDPHATHVLQKAVMLFQRNIQKEKAGKLKVEGLESPDHENQNLLTRVEKIVSEEFMTLAVHPHACRLVQRTLGDCNPASSPFVETMMRIVQDHYHDLSIDQHGNFILQHILDDGSIEQVEAVQAYVCSRVVELAQHKFGSHLVEKCLTSATQAQANNIVAQLIKPTKQNAQNLGEPDEDGDGSVLMVLMKDPYANFVVQRAFDVSGDKLKMDLAREIRCRAEMLQRFTYGRHILAHVNRSGIGY